jgi:hypothetical protein
MRRVEKFNKKLEVWFEIEFKDLVNGDIFRLYDDGIRYINSEDGNNVWIVKGLPFVNKEGIWSVHTLY